VKYICKTAEPEAFRLWKIRNKRTRGKKKVVKWDKFPTTECRYFRQHLIDEQLGMCCYCEVMISLGFLNHKSLRVKLMPDEREELERLRRILPTAKL